jgi:hypothetical protein
MLIVSSVLEGCCGVNSVFEKIYEAAMALAE